MFRTPRTIAKRGNIIRGKTRETPRLCLWLNKRKAHVTIKKKFVKVQMNEITTGEIFVFIVSICSRFCYLFFTLLLQILFINLFEKGNVA